MSWIWHRGVKASPGAHRPVPLDRTCRRRCRRRSSRTREVVGQHAPAVVCAWGSGRRLEVRVVRVDEAGIGLAEQREAPTPHAVTGRRRGRSPGSRSDPLSRPASMSTSPCPMPRTSRPGGPSTRSSVDRDRRPRTRVAQRADAAHDVRVAAADAAVAVALGLLHASARPRRRCCRRCSVSTTSTPGTGPRARSARTARRSAGPGGTAPRTPPQRLAASSTIGQRQLSMRAKSKACAQVLVHAEDEHVAVVGLHLAGLQDQQAVLVFEGDGSR